MSRGTCQVQICNRESPVRVSSFSQIAVSQQIQIYPGTLVADPTCLFPPRPTQSCRSLLARAPARFINPETQTYHGINDTTNAAELFGRKLQWEAKDEQVVLLMSWLKLSMNRPWFVFPWLCGGVMVWWQSLASFCKSVN